MAGRLAGKTALITGAAAGMGKAIAIAYLQEGANVFGVDLNTERLEELGKEAAELGYGAQYKWAKCDITNTEDCANAVKACVDAFGTMNVLSHNAGVMDNYTPVDKLTDKEWDFVLSVNMTGTMKICRAALQYFIPNEIKASMVLITSNTAYESCTGGPTYCASKGGANSLMRALSFEYARKGIRCNSICPGPIAATKIAESMKNVSEEGYQIHQKSGYNPHAHEWMIKPYGVPEDIAPLSVYLASDESSFVTSASIIIDGGVCLGGA